MMGALAVTITPGPVVVLSGQADTAGIEDLVAALYGHLADGAAGLIADVAGLSFIDSAALHVLTGLALRLRARGGQLTLRNPQKPVADLLEMTGAATVMAVEASGSCSVPA